MKPYAKHSLDLSLSLGLDRLRPTEERTFWRLYESARHRPPLAGYLADTHGHPFAYRDLERLCRIPLATLHRHVRRLQRAGLILADISGRLFLPHILAAHVADPPPALTTTTTKKGGSVENQPGLWAGASSGVPPPGTSPFQSSGTPHPELEELSTYVSSTSEPGENLSDSASEYAFSLSGVLKDPDLRWLLGKLASRSDAWRVLVTTERERMQLAALEQTHPGPLRRALEQASSLNGDVRNAGAWLGTTVRRMAGESA